MLINIHLYAAALMSEVERLLAQCPWKEFLDGGKTYYNNTETKESVWTIPKELKELKDKLAASKAPSDSDKVQNSSSIALIESQIDKNIHV